MSYLNKKCLRCDKDLLGSRHVSRNERKKRDLKKLYCDGVCAAIYKANRLPSVINSFLYQGK